MPCPDENLILDLFAGRLPQRAREELDEHVTDCSDCRALVFEVRVASQQDREESARPAQSSVWLAALGLVRTGRLFEGARELVAGTSIADRYVLERPIGEGGMGIVWAAVSSSTGEPVALKFLKAMGDERAARLMREARILASLKHPGIVEVLEVLPGESGAGFPSSPVIVMELLSGEPLSATLRARGPLGFAETVRIMSPVLEAIEAVHAAGIVHRDLKPENVFVLAPPNAGVKVLDFGLAKRTSWTATAVSSGSGLTRPGAIVGTPHYMAPEQVFGEKTVDGRADVWAIGVLIYECLAGKRPIVGDSFGQVIKNITMGTIPPLSSVAAVPIEVSDLVHAMLSRSPEARPTLAAVAGVLRSAVLDDRTSASTPPRPRPRRTVFAIGALALIGAGVAYAWLAKPESALRHGSQVEPDTRAPSVPDAPAEVNPVRAATSIASPPEPPALVGTTARAPARTAASRPPAPSASASAKSKLAGGVEKDSPY